MGYYYLKVKLTVGGVWRNFEENGRKDLEQIVGSNLNVNDPWKGFR